MAAPLAFLLKQLPKRREVVQRCFSRLCTELRLESLLGTDSRWAIVGGAVRDMLLSSHIDNEMFWGPWKDLDVAINSSSCVLAKGGMGTGRIRVTRNSFGGWKLELPQQESADAWLIGEHVPELHPGANWYLYLAHFDFGPNAVAFVWPEQEVVIHRAWLAQVRGAIVERMARSLPRPAVQPVRAVALAVHLEALTGYRFRFGDRILSDVRRLAEGSNSDRAECLAYLTEKVARGRWPPAVAWRLVQLLGQERGGRFAKTVVDQLESTLIRSHSL